MSLIQRMDEFIAKLESDDQEFLKELDSQFQKYCEEKEKKNMVIPGISIQMSTMAKKYTVIPGISIQTSTIAKKNDIPSESKCMDRALIREKRYGKNYKSISIKSLSSYDYNGAA